MKLKYHSIGPSRQRQAHLSWQTSRVIYECLPCVSRSGEELAEPRGKESAGRTQTQAFLRDENKWSEGPVTIETTEIKRTFVERTCVNLNGKHVKVSTGIDTQESIKQNRDECLLCSGAHHFPFQSNEWMSRGGMENWFHCSTAVFSAIRSLKRWWVSHYIY